MHNVPVGSFCVRIGWVQELDVCIHLFVGGRTNSMELANTDPYLHTYRYLEVVRVSIHPTPLTVSPSYLYYF